MAGNARVPGQSQARRIVTLLRSFDQRHRRQTLSQIARRAGLPVGTCHRMLTELVQLQILNRRTDGTYSIGHLLWELGMLSPVQRGLREVALPYMQDLLAATRQVVNLFVLEGHSALLLERIAGSAVGKPIAAAGERLPLHTSAAGKIFLAYGAMNLDELVMHKLDQETEHSITDVPRLRRDIELVRQRGWATTSQEHHTGAWGLAVPVMGEERQVVAALGIVALSEIKDPDVVLPALKVASAAISRSLAFRTLGETG